MDDEALSRASSERHIDKDLLLFVDIEDKVVELVSNLVVVDVVMSNMVTNKASAPVY